MGRRSLPFPEAGVTPVSTRNEAALLGRKVFYTGKPCANGHFDWRYVCNDGCRSCMKPPKPVAPWVGEGGYTHVLQLKLRVRALPPAEEIKYLQLEAERAMDKFLVMMGHIPRKPDED